ncbi:MAG: excinuclease ABC subunit UvrC [Blastochloris viridis]|uniref:UvrABC system protein C n=1 Tax=Blastochloris viridis TaxID=1079 RepID=A0A6N4QZS3_BLAVI|nr:MAG: excinuclease ABC subunit UvrC [Blastochloris viridis]
MSKDITDGIEVIKGRLANLPTSPGVYRMLNAKGDVLYVGKARNLKARLTSYTQPERMVVRIRKMVFETRDLVVVEVPTEAEALLLEANLIKSLKPRYNIIFRDDSSYVSVLITDEETPLIKSHRGARRTKGDYFGPYPSASAVYQTLDLMERAFRLRTCVETVFRNRTRPCLKYDIKRCSGPCVGKIDRQAYAATVAQAKKFLRGERGEVLKDMQRAMEKASAELEFEQAGVIRDRIKALSHVSGGSALSHALAEADVFAIVREGGRLGIQAFYYRNGQHVGNQMYYPKFDMGTREDSGEAEDELAEALRVFLALHYTQRAAVGQVVCNIAPADVETLSEALSVSSGRKVKIEVPRLGDKRAVVDHAIKNAMSALHRKNAENDGWATQMASFGEMLGLPRSLELLECYDISNISGRFPVASCVVAGREGMLRQRYRRYHIKTKNTPDDYAMLREVLTRRVEKGMKELTFDDEGRPVGLPDVLLVDGGKGQLNVLVDVVRTLGLLGQPECPALVGIAKGEERDKGLETIFQAKVDAHGEVTLEELPVTFNSALIFVLQRIRDEAHRFAITFHRESRGKALAVSRLDGIPGVGPTKKKALLLHFGSVEGVRGASLEALSHVSGIGEDLAQVIYDYFKTS